MKNVLQILSDRVLLTLGDDLGLGGTESITFLMNLKNNVIDFPSMTVASNSTPTVTIEEISMRYTAPTTLIWSSDFKPLCNAVFDANPSLRKSGIGRQKFMSLAAQCAGFNDIAHLTNANEQALLYSDDLTTATGQRYLNLYALFPNNIALSHDKKLCIAVEGTEVYREPFVDYGNGLYAAGVEFYQVGNSTEGVAISAADWDALIDSIQNAISNSAVSDSSQLHDLIIDAIDSFGRLDRWCFPGDYLDVRSELITLLKQASDESEVRNLVISWYDVDSDYDCPLDELIDYCVSIWEQSVSF